MIENLKKNLSLLLKEWRTTLLFGLLIVIFFFLIRLFRLGNFPIFADEAIYIRWAQVMRAEQTLRFLPMSDGKQPLFMWLMIPFLKLFSDPLLAGRFLSVLAGFFSLTGIFVLSYWLTKNKKISLFSCLFYSAIPFFVFFDRLSLVDSLLVAWGIWVFLLGLLMIQFLRLDLAMIAGIILGAALITKSPALFFAGLLPSTIILSPWINFKKKEETGLKLLKLVILWAVVYVFAAGIYNLLRLGPNFQLIAMRNKDYLFSLKEILVHPQDPFLPHFRDLVSWLPNLLTWPALILGVWGLIKAFKDQRKVTIILLIWFVAPLLAQLFFARDFNPRYLLVAIWPWVIFAGWGLASLIDLSFKKFGQKKVGILLAVGLVIFSIFPASKYDFILAKDPQESPLPIKLRSGHLEDWSSGYGINEVRDYLKEVSLNQKIVVGTEGYFGTLPDGLQIYFDKDSQVTIVGVGIDLTEIPEPLVEAAKTTPTFLVINQSRIQIQNDPSLEQVMKIPKAKNRQGKQDYLLLYRLK